MRMIALAAALGAVLPALAACGDGGRDEAAAEANDTLGANFAGDAAAQGSAGTGAAGTVGADGDLDVDVNLKVPQPRLEGVTVGPEGATVNVGDGSAKVRPGDDPSVSVTTNRY